MSGFLCLSLRATLLPGLAATLGVHAVLGVGLGVRAVLGVGLGLLGRAGGKAGAGSSQAGDKPRRCAALPSPPLPSPSSFLFNRCSRVHCKVTGGLLVYLGLKERRSQEKMTQVENKTLSDRKYRWA